MLVHLNNLVMNSDAKEILTPNFYPQDPKFKASLDYLVSSRPFWAIARSCLKTNKWNKPKPTVSAVQDTETAQHGTVPCYSHWPVNLLANSLSL